ncbi:MAG TPA: AtzH-like domain-containing protein [Pseudonocardia sp.]|nr:AtzH-like domain-containing protein [Pseudonocardia sp.]
MSGYDTATDDGLLAAFWDYERALRTNDVPALEHWFLAGPDTLRSDGGTTLVGAGHIARFRRSRQPPGPRRVDRVHLRPLGGGSAAVVAESTRPDGTCAVQSQIWVSGPAGWRIAVAHVSAAAPLLPTISEPAGVWRVAGPLRVDPGPAAAGALSAAGPLSGVRLAVKDLFALAGQAIGGGSADWLAEAPVQTTTAPSVAALLAAGATVAGLAHTDELAFSLAGVTQSYGAVPNPAAPGCLSGGSSSGPAAAVAGHAADLGVGTDTAGSIRVPASYCGLFGLRPTHGAIDTEGVLPLAPSFDTVGLLSRDPQLLATAAGLLLPPAGNNRSVTPVQLLLRVGDLIDGTDPGVAPAFESATVALAGRTGCAVEAAPDLAEAVDTWLPAFRTVQAAEAWAAHGEFVTKARSGLQPEVVARFEAGRELTEDAVARARAVLAGARDRLAELLPPGRALLLPATSGPALPLDLAAGEVDSARVATLRLTCLASLAGLPAVAVPTMRLGTRPMGLSLVGAAGSDRSLLELINRPAPWDRP